MNPTGLFHLTAAYVRANLWRTLLLILTVALTFFLPLAFQSLTTQSEELLNNRAESTPLIIGPKGSSTDLTLTSLYFTPNTLPPLKHQTLSQLRDSNKATFLPLHLRFHANGAPIVGTNLNYLKFRNLNFSEGHAFTTLGECVLGSKVAQKRKLKVGDSIISSPENLFDLAGAYPLKLKIRGILEPSHTPDDSAVFVDLKTAWIIEGLAHGHQDLAEPSQKDNILRKEGATLRANAALTTFNEITPSNIDSFHFHGDFDDFPLSAIIAQPQSKKEHDILIGRFLDPDNLNQIVIPSESISRLSETLFATRTLVTLGLSLLALCSLLLLALVLNLSLRLREREFTTYARIGADKITVLFLKLGELFFVVTIAATIAALGILAANSLSESFLQILLN